MAMAELTAAPQRSLQQRFDALEQANKVRAHRARLKKAMTRELAMSILRDPDPMEESWKVADLLLSVPKVGRVKRNKAMARAQVSLTRTVAGVTPQARERLFGVLGWL